MRKRAYRRHPAFFRKRKKTYKNSCLQSSCVLAGDGDGHKSELHNMMSWPQLSFCGFSNDNCRLPNAIKTGAGGQPDDTFVCSAAAESLSVWTLWPSRKCVAAFSFFVRQTQKAKKKKKKLIAASF